MSENGRCVDPADAGHYPERHREPHACAGRLSDQTRGECITAEQIRERENREDGQRRDAPIDDLDQQRRLYQQRLQEV
jgi:hypothetical protein